MFAGANTIQLHDANGNAVATLDAQTAELTILPAYQSTMETRVSFAQHIPVLQLIDTTTDTALFAMHIPSKELANSQGIQLLNGNYALVPIQDTFVGEFAGGYCVQNPSEVCELYISEEGTIYAPEPYNSSYQATYAFDQTKNSVIYTVSSLQGVPVVSLNFIAEPLTQ